MPRKKVDRFEDERGGNNIDAMDYRYEPYFTEDEVRQNLEMEYHNAFWFDERKKPKNVVYAWPTTEVCGVKNDKGMRQCIMQGWTPVPPERHPELVLPDIYGRRDAQKSNTIEVLGHILMERSIELERKAQEITYRRNMEKLTEADAVEKYTGMSHYPIGVNKNVTELGIAPFRNFN